MYYADLGGSSLRELPHIDSGAGVDAGNDEYTCYSLESSGLTILSVCEGSALEIDTCLSDMEAVSDSLRE